MADDGSAQLKISATGSNFVLGQAKWTSSNPSIASVSSDGIVTSGSRTGTATITVTLDGKTAKCTVTVKKLPRMSNSTISLAPNTQQSAENQSPLQYKSGVAHRPVLVVKMNGVTLKLNTDYTITWPSDATIYGKGNYAGSTTFNYTVVCPLSKTSKSGNGLSGGTITVKKGEKKAPVITFSGSNSYKYTLKEGTDYTVTWPNVTTTGTKKVTMTGRGAWTGVYTYNLKVIGGATWTRLWGNSLFDTMQSIVKTGWSTTGGTVVIATAGGFADALSAAGVAGLTGAPILLVNKNSLPSQTKTELSRLKPKSIIIAGGDGAVSNKVANQIKSVTGVAPKRIYGETATGTAAALNKAFAKQWTSGVAILATNKTFYDALSAAPISYSKHYPIFLSEGNSNVSNETINAMKACGIKQVIVVGGDGAVKDSVVNKLKRNGIALKIRLWGETAYDTSKSIATWAVQNGMSANNMGVATGKSFYDALCGAALCGKNNAALVLADSKNSKNSTFASANKNSILQGYVFGGDGAVPNSVYNKFVSATK